ncbi:hypothetical protein BVC71_12815 [Marivivens niveibacter]|uniref:Nickel/cobalt efflux system n=1 Tax=Marivivens niveibacter TaxID=1930667 RepID=A0A251WW82_9RHOB|nr:hypothetical protein [Marivivens niveibacter]OUD08388.1 hypothetical protein BVC71_12815 [Marivivens niveibacter]
MRLALFLIAVVVVAISTIHFVDLARLSYWAIDAQRAFQNQMAGAIRALKSGEVGAYATLCGAPAAYGFVHALGPGHGKYLIGGVGLGSSVPMSKLIGLATVSSLAQSVWAIVLVFGGFAIVKASAQQLTTMAEEYLAPISYLAIAGIGVVFIWRGLKTAWQVGLTRHDQHEHACEQHCNCAAHGPTPDQVNGVQSIREAIGLVISIAIRPCTGAIFLLVIAWQMELAMAGAVAVIAMGLGTATLTSIVAVSSVFARNLAVLSIGHHPRWGLIMPGVQMCSGIVIAAVSLSLLGIRLG